MIGTEPPKSGTWKDTWQTPGRILRPIRRFAPIGLDVATAPSNPTEAERFFTEADDGLKSRWGIEREHPLIFANPPYSDTGAWIDKATGEAGAGEEIIMLIPARTGAKYWAPCFQADAICFLSGRIAFVDADTGLEGDGARFESALIYWGMRNGRFRRKMAKIGNTVFPLQSDILRRKRAKR